MSERLQNATFFPPVETALADPNGLLAMGGDLSVTSRGARFSLVPG